MEKLRMNQAVDILWTLSFCCEWVSEWFEESLEVEIIFWVVDSGGLVGD